MHVLHLSLTTVDVLHPFLIYIVFSRFHRPPLIWHSMALTPALNESCCPHQSVQLHMQLLVHASQCTRTTCQSQNCAKMKALLKHGASCNLRAARGCQICRRIWALLQIHARHCKTQDKCPVPRCRDLKNHLRRLRYDLCLCMKWDLLVFDSVVCWLSGSLLPVPSSILTEST